MGTLEWSIILGWPIAVALINNWLTHRQLKHMAEVSSDAFNKTGTFLKYVLESIRDMEKSIKGLGGEIASPIDSKGEKAFVDTLFRRP